MIGNGCKVFYLFFEDREKGLKYFKLIIVINKGWTAGTTREYPEEYKLWVNDKSVYSNLFDNFSFGGGINHLQLRGFDYPGLVAINIDDFTKNRKHNYWGYHFGINYDWKSLGFLLQYSRTNISKEDLAKEYSYPARKISLLTFSVLYKFKLGKIKKNKKRGLSYFLIFLKKKRNIKKYIPLFFLDMPCPQCH